MSITLTYLGTTAQLGDRLIWSDEFAWSPVEQVTEPGTTGALMVHVGVRSAGRFQMAPPPRILSVVMPSSLVVSGPKNPVFP